MVVKSVVKNKSSAQGGAGAGSFLRNVAAAGDIRQQRGHISGPNGGYTLASDAKRDVLRLQDAVGDAKRCLHGHLCSRQIFREGQGVHRTDMFLVSFAKKRPDEPDADY